MDVICAKKERIPAVNLHTQRSAAYGLDPNWPMACVCADQEQRMVFKILKGCKKKEKEKKEKEKREKEEEEQVMVAKEEDNLEQQQ